jgi:hypothetical protein
MLQLFILFEDFVLDASTFTRVFCGGIPSLLSCRCHNVNVSAYCICFNWLVGTSSLGSFFCSSSSSSYYYYYYYYYYCCCYYYCCWCCSCCFATNTLLLLLLLLLYLSLLQHVTAKQCWPHITRGRTVQLFFGLLPSFIFCLCIKGQHFVFISVFVFLTVEDVSKRVVGSVCFMSVTVMRHRWNLAMSLTINNRPWNAFMFWCTSILGIVTLAPDR